MTRWVLLCALIAGCGGAQPKGEAKPPPVPLDPPVAVEPAAYTGARAAAPPVLIRDAAIWTATLDRPRIARGWIRLRDGLIAGIGEGDAPAPEDGEQVVDAQGKIVTPGLIDSHSHLGVYASPGTWAHADGNEMTNPITAGVRAEEGFWPQDPGIERAVAGGVTTIMALPGSGNLIGGRGVVLKLHPAREARAMRFPGAKDGLKMACGENPKRVYGEGKGSMPMSRMGSLYLMREKFIAARRYRQKWANWRQDPSEEKHGRALPKTPPDRDLVLETLAAVLDGEVLVHVHCYRADEMLLQLKLADEFGYAVRSFHHAVEAYKIRDVLAQKGVSVSTWADWWGFKLEAFDAIEENIALLAAAGARPIVHSDSAEGIQRLNQEAGKALGAGLAAGLPVDADAALRWVTVNPAWALGVDAQTGTLEAGKMADVVVWDQDPLSVYARAEKVWIDGHLRHDAAAPGAPWSDFEAGLGAGITPAAGEGTR
ncbi:MAG: amidohydrolase [Myxococcales bacterium]|nr:amidohydrolase [Myxococcales bacterium]